MNIAGREPITKPIIAQPVPRGNFFISHFISLAMLKNPIISPTANRNSTRRECPKSVLSADTVSNMGL